MAEVGVLQLTIEDNSESAAKGLGHLADVLERVRNAVGSGLGLEGTANEIEKIAKVVNDAISGSTITKLGQFADAVKGLKGINLKGVVNAMQGFDQGSAIENTKNQVNSLSTEFTKAWTAMNTFYTKYAEIKSLVTGTNTSLLGSGGVSPENALSTQVWTGPNWSPDWTHGENFHPGWTSDIDKVREDAIEVEYTVTDAIEGTAQAVSGTADAISDGMTVVSSAMEGVAGSTGTVTDGMVEVEASVEAATGSAHRFADALDFIKTKAKGAWSALWQTREGVNGLKGAFSAMFPTLSTFMSGMGRIAKYRLIRTIIKQITSGMSEGIQNVYHYSKAIGGSFAPAMDSAASALLQMKNAVGAALAPMIESLIPYLQIVVNWFITLINYVNQFVALMRGQQTWTRAIPKTTQAFDDQTKAAKKAGAAIKDLLADWDELNIIQSESGGGAGNPGTDAAEDYLNMFEEVGKYEKWIKNLVDGINDQFGDIWGLVKQIGISILGWKLSSVFTGWLGTIAGIVGAGAVASLVFNVTTLLDKQFLKTGEDGWLIANVLETLLGVVLMEGVLGNVLDGSFAQIAIPLTLSVSAIADFVTVIRSTDVSAISEEALKLSALGALKSGVAAGYIAHLFGSSLGASIAGGAVATLLTFGVTIGIKAVQRSVKGQITEETIKAAALSSLAMGVGAGMFAKLVDASVLGSLGIGAAAAGLTILTISAAIGIKAIITSKQKDIEWGNLTLTQEQVKSFVLNEMFEAGFNAKLEMIKGTVEASQDAKDDIQSQIESIEIPVSKLKWKIDEDAAIEDLRKQVFGDEENGTTGLIGKFKTLAKQQENLVETSLTLVPIKGDNGTDESGKFAAASIEGWDILTEAMDNLGLELNQHLTNSMNKNLTEEMRQYEKNAAVEIVETMARVSRAAASGLTSGQSEVKFSIGLENMSRESIGDAVALYQEYIDNIKQEYVELTTETAASFRSQASAFAELANSTQDAELKRYYQQKAKEYEDLFNEYKEKALHGVEEATKGDQAKGHALFVEWIQKTLQFTPEDFGKVMHTANPLSDYVKTLISGLGITIRQSDGAYTDDMKDQLGNVLSGMLEALLSKEDYETIKEAVDAGLLNYADIFQDDAIQQIIDYIGSDSYYGDAIRTAWERMTQDAVGDGAENQAISNEIDVNTTVNETIETVTENVSDGTGALPTGGQAAVEEYQAQAAELTATAAEVERNVNTLTLDDLTFDTKGAQDSAGKAAGAIEDMARRIRAAFQSLDGLGFTFSAGNADTVLEKMHAAIHVSVPAAASGAVFKSGDIFSANENGQAELIGSYGNKTAVMNNDQVVGAVTNGVAQANSGVEDRLSSIENALERLIRTGMTAKVTPGSRWSRHAQASAVQFSRVTG